jgi:hypothetical protein
MFSNVSPRIQGLSVTYVGSSQLVRKPKRSDGWWTRNAAAKMATEASAS